MADKQLYNVGVVKIPYERRDVAHRHLSEGDWIEQYSEEAEVGEPARYGAWLDDTAHEEFREASNVRYVEPATLVRKVYEVPDSPFPMQPSGVAEGALSFTGFFGLRLRSAAVVCVADTGLKITDYVSPRLEDMWNFTDSDTTLDRDGHGTWCAHAATSRDGTLVSAKVLGDDGTGYDTWIIAAVDRFVSYCRSRDRNGILSASLGGDLPARGYQEAGERALRSGVLCIAASGNDGWRDRISYPAFEPSWMAVGATDHHQAMGMIANFSNRRPPDEPNIYAPGVGVNGEGAGGWSGTSMATPIVARAAAQLIALNGVGPTRARSAILRGAVKKDTHDGIGVLHLAQAYEVAKRWAV